MTNPRAALSVAAAATLMVSLAAVQAPCHECAHDPTGA